MKIVLEMEFFKVTFFCFFLFVHGCQRNRIIDQIKQFISTNPSFLESLDQSKIIDYFTRHALLRKYLIQEKNGATKINWNRLISSRFGKNLIEKISNEGRILQKRNLSSLFDFIADLLKNLIFQLLAVPTCEHLGLRYSTNKTDLPDEIKWSEIFFAKELMNNLNKEVIIAGGEKPIDSQKWNEFRPFFPYQKNIHRNLIFKKTFLMRSPNTDIHCKNENCLRIVNYRDYTWVELAKMICMTYIPSKVDSYNPSPGYLISTTIEKCQAVFFEREIYQLDDGRGNFYVMHAFETNGPSLDVVLPKKWTLRRINISEPLIITPFGSNNECYFNILRDSLGQGYHQYIYADHHFPK